MYGGTTRRAHSLQSYERKLERHASLFLRALVLFIEINSVPDSAVASLSAAILFVSSSILRKPKFVKIIGLDTYSQS